MATMPSHLAQFIVWLHERAQSEGRVPSLTEHEIDVLDAIRFGARLEPGDAEIDAGMELYDGRPHSDLARKLQRRAVAKTSDLDLVLDNLDEVGYTPVNVRALLSTHFDTLRYSPLGSDANCAYIDLTTAINRASDRTRTVAWLLVAGLGPQEIGTLLSTNGSRKINRALGELAKILEGRYYAKTDNRPGR